MTRTETETEAQTETSHVESQGPFHRVVVERHSVSCFPNALFDNVASEARDHCGSIFLSCQLIEANERTFLSWLRLSIVLAVVGVAVIINFSLNPVGSGSEKDRNLAKAYHLPIGILFSIPTLYKVNRSRCLHPCSLCGPGKLLQDNQTIRSETSLCTSRLWNTVHCDHIRRVHHCRGNPFHFHKSRPSRELIIRTYEICTRYPRFLSLSVGDGCLTTTSAIKNDINFFPLNDSSCGPINLLDSFSQSCFLFLFVRLFVALYSDIFRIEPALTEIRPFRCFGRIIRRTEFLTRLKQFEESRIVNVSIPLPLPSQSRPCNQYTTTTYQPHPVLCSTCERVQRRGRIREDQELFHEDDSIPQQSPSQSPPLPHKTERSPS